jgi:predicted nuclease of predicted toxin-antitoxin system
MKFKLDENFGASIQKIFQDRGHDCLTVLDEKLSGAPDNEILNVSTVENRILVTMDHDFGNVFTYPPEHGCGIALINPPGRSSLKLSQALVLTLLEALKSHDINGRLWIVEPGRIREHEPD